VGLLLHCPQLNSLPHWRVKLAVSPKQVCPLPQETTQQNVEALMGMQQPALAALPTPSQDERTMAFLAHLLQAFTGFIGPLIIFCVKQDSRFVKFHALQSLVWQLCYMALIFLVSIGFIFSIFSSVAHIPPGSHQGPPPGFFIFFPVFWLLIMGGWIVNVILGVLYGIKANRGEWAAYPIIGQWLLPKEVS
jgi:uncharacterized protein